MSTNASIAVVLVDDSMRPEAIARLLQPPPHTARGGLAGVDRRAR